MRDSLFLFTSLVALAAASSGCMGGHHGYARTAGALHLVEDLVQLAEATQDAQPSSNPEAEWTAADDRFYTRGTEEYVAGPPQPRPIPPHEPASAADTRVESHVPFDLAGAYVAIDGVDLGGCRPEGLAGGYGRVVLSFDASGAPAAIRVELPAGSAPGARTCVEEALLKVRVDPFDGTARNVRRTFFVKG